MWGILQWDSNPTTQITKRQPKVHVLSLLNVQALSFSESQKVVSKLKGGNEQKLSKIWRKKLNLPDQKTWDRETYKCSRPTDIMIANESQTLVYRSSVFFFFYFNEL